MKIKYKPLNLGQQISSLLEIERDCYADPWDRETFHHCLKQKNTTGMTVEIDGKLVGYIIYQKNKSKYTIVNLAVVQKHQRQGLATKLLKSLKLSLRNDDVIEMIVSDICIAAHMFLKSQGFQAKKVEKKYFKVGNSYEDGYLFNYKCQESTLTADEFEEMICGKK